MLSHLAPPPGHLDLKNMNLLQIPSGPPSPTLSTTSFMSSVSWMAEKTSNELIPMLKGAYSALKDKEKGELQCGDKTWLGDRDSRSKKKRIFYMC
jgi:hypothetical protein